MRQLQSVHRAWHFDIRKNGLDVIPRLKNFDGFTGTGSGQNVIAFAIKSAVMDIITKNSSSTTSTVVTLAHALVHVRDGITGPLHSNHDPGRNVPAVAG
jgi:hypothetical protein